jgi:hypothetical protein
LGQIHSYRWMNMSTQSTTRQPGMRQTHFLDAHSGGIGKVVSRLPIFDLFWFIYFGMWFQSYSGLWEALWLANSIQLIDIFQFIYRDCLRLDKAIEQIIGIGQRDFLSSSNLHRYIKLKGH